MDGLRDRKKPKLNHFELRSKILNQDLFHTQNQKSHLKSIPPNIKCSLLKLVHLQKWLRFERIGFKMACFSHYTLMKSFLLLIAFTIRLTGHLWTPVMDKLLSPTEKSCLFAKNT